MGNNWKEWSRIEKDVLCVLLLHLSAHLVPTSTTMSLLGGRRNRLHSSEKTMTIHVNSSQMKVLPAEVSFEGAPPLLNFFWGLIESEGALCVLIFLRNLKRGVWLESGDWQSGTFVGAFIGSLSHAHRGWCTGCILASWLPCRVAQVFHTKSSKPENIFSKPIPGFTTHFLRIGGIGAGAFFRPKDRTVILFSPSSLGFFKPVSTLLNLVFSRALPRVAFTAL